MDINWIIKKFDKLSVSELYAIMQLRNEVFVVEQDCVYQDADNKDQQSLHFGGWLGDKLVAYTRIIPPGVSYPEAGIGRVVSSPEFRHQGIGRQLMIESIKQCSRLFSNIEIKIGAQLYLKNFYQSLGFIQCSAEYLEDGIPHIEMILNN